MKKPLTNAGIYIEAESPKEAMEIAKKWKDKVDDAEFEDSDVEVDCCDAYPKETEALYMETIYTKDEAIDVDDYIERYESQDPEEVARGGWDMTNQLELNLEE